MRNDFLTWWVRQLADCLPGAFGRGSGVAADALIIRAGHVTGTLDIVSRRKGRETALGRFGSDEGGIVAMRRAIGGTGRPAMVILQVPPAALLEREVVLPLAAERELRQVLAFEMDRLTPFAVDEVYWSSTVERRDRTNGRLHLRLVLVPRAAMRPAIEALERAGAAPAVIEAAQSEMMRLDGPPRRIDLNRTPSSRAFWRRRALIAAGAGCAALGLALIVLPFALQARARQEVEDRISALQPRIAEAETLRHDLAARTASIDVISAERARVGDPLAVLAALTEILPDDTYLTSFKLGQGVIELSGQSGAAARLIAALSADPAIRNPAFGAPVTRVENGKADLFSIRAEIAR